MAHEQAADGEVSRFVLVGCPRRALLTETNVESGDVSKQERNLCSLQVTVEDTGKADLGVYEARNVRHNHDGLWASGGWRGDPETRDQQTSETRS